jgi:alcohol dehydrogenase (cytochrome c)
VVRGKVIQGVSSCNGVKGGCFIVALDAHTGSEAWRFQTIARPGQPGGDSWNGAPVDERFGGAVWNAGSYDPDLNLLYYGVGQTYDTATLLQPQARQGESADALYTDSTLALDPDTGRLVWHYQHFNRDVWDFDWSFERLLVDLNVGGVPRKLSVTGGKIAVFDAIDRTSGRYLFSKDLGLQTLVKAIDPKTGRKIIDPALEPEAGKTKSICPHAGGARSWLGTALDPRTKILYVPLVESCMDFTWKPRAAADTAGGGSDIGWVLKARPDSDGNFGRVEALNLQTGKVAWIRRRRAPQASAILATAGGVIFEGSRDRTFRASDSATGKTLWSLRLNASPSSTPVAYSVGGQQYVAVVAGGGGAHDVTWPALTPEIVSPAGGASLWVFKLPPAVGKSR